MRIYQLGAIVIFLALTGCASMMYQPYDYQAALIEVQRPSDIADRYSEQITIEQSEEGEEQYMYSDSLISIAWIVGDEQLSFILENKTQHSMRVLWDEVTFVDITGNSSRVMHEGVRYVDRNASQPPSVVPSNGRLIDIVVPTSNVYYVSGQYGGWRTAGLIQPRNTSLGETEEALSNIGRRFSVLFPVELQGVTNEYTFNFEVKDVVVPQPSTQ